MRTVEELIKIAPDKYVITVFGAEPHAYYNRIMLTSVLSGAINIPDIMIHDFDWYQRRRITLHIGPDKAVVNIDRKRRQVSAKDGAMVIFDKLLIATGSLPLMLEIPGRYVEGVMGFRDLADLETLINTAAIKQHKVVLGGGLLGLEVADGLLHRGMLVTVINRAGHLLNRQIDRTSAVLLQQQLEQRGIRFRLGVTIAEIISKQQQIKQIRLCNGNTLPADLLVMATGIRPNIALAQETGLPFRHGIIVNDQMQTSNENVYAVGECVGHRGDVFGMAAPILEQAKVCARQLAGNSDAVYQTPLSATVLKVSGIDLFTIGDFEGGTDSQQQILIDHGMGVYRKISTKNDRIGGVILYGDTSDSHIYQNLITSQINIASIRDRLVFNQPTLTI